MNAFKFVGKLEFNSLDSKVPYVRSGKTKNGDDYHTLSFSVVPAKNNRAFVECFGMVQKKIKTRSTDNTETTIDWADRLDEKVVNSVARYRRYSIKLNGKYNEFITPYDFVQFALDHIDELKSKLFVVTGSVNINVYNGKISFRYQVQNIREVAEDEDIESKLTVRFDTFYRKQDIDLDRWDKEKEITINAFSYQFIDKENGNKYVPTTFYINLANETNDKKAALFLKQFGIDGNKAKIKDNEVVSLPVRCEYINGSEEVAFDETCLTDNQRELVELGLKTLDDFKPNGSIFGQRVTKFYCVDADLRGDYADGYKVEQITPGEFEAEIYSPEAKTVNASDSSSADIEALFG